jgi:hypothetical protein
MTSLFIANQHVPLKGETPIIFLDGNGNGVVRTSVCLWRLDVDAINVCETIRKGGYPVPAAGMVQVRLGEVSPATFLVSGWVKNYTGKILKRKDDPYNSPGYVNGLGKTRCEHKIKFGGFFGDFSWLQWVPPRYVSGTGEDDCGSK